MRSQSVRTTVSVLLLSLGIFAQSALAAYRTVICVAPQAPASVLGFVVTSRAVQMLYNNF